MECSQIAREIVPPRYPSRLVEQFTRPPPVLWRRGHSDDIACLEVEFGTYTRIESVSPTGNSLEYREPDNAP